MLARNYFENKPTWEISKGDDTNAQLKYSSQLPLFSMSSKLLILHGEAKSYCLFTVSHVPESMFYYL